MKKALLIFVALVAILGIIHVLGSRYGGLRGVGHRIQGRIINPYSQLVGDPGACALIRGYWWRSIHENLRNRCVEKYVQSSVDEISDCRTEKFITDLSFLSSISLWEEYRFTCLMKHYQAMLGNEMTQEWLPQECLVIRDKLVVMDHYFANIRLARNTNNQVFTPESLLSDKDISTMEQCEGFLDTPKIYAFLRDHSNTQEEKTYQEEQKKRVFQFQ